MPSNICFPVVEVIVPVVAFAVAEVVVKWVAEKEGRGGGLVHKGGNFGFPLGVYLVFMSLEGKPPMYEDILFPKNKKSKIQSQTNPNQLQLSP